VLLNMGALVSPEYQEDVVGIYRFNPERLEANEFRLGEQDVPLVKLMGFGFDRETSVLKLRWQAKGTLEKDYTAFAHVVRSPDQPPLGQADVAPELPTHYWRYDESFITVHAIQYQDPLPAGNYQLIVGWYDPETLQRLVLPRPADAEPDAPPLTTFHLFSFAVDDEGNIISPELDELEKQLKLEATPEPTAEATVDVTLDGTGEAISVGGPDATLVAPLGTGEAVDAATSQATTEVETSSDGTAEATSEAEAVLETTAEATEGP
jgi:hypothetical protein